MSADHEPLGATCACPPCEIVKVLLWPSIENVKVGNSVLPLRSIIPLPLLDVSIPLTVKDSPAAGLAIIGSTVKLVGDLTVMVVIREEIECNVEEPLKNKVTAISPRG